MEALWSGAWKGWLRGGKKTGMLNKAWGQGEDGAWEEREVERGNVYRPRVMTNYANLKPRGEG